MIKKNPNVKHIWSKRIKMLRCRICDCICDPADLIGMVCDDCIEKYQKEKEREQEMKRLAKAEFEQIRLEGFVK